MKILATVHDRSSVRHGQEFEIEYNIGENLSEAIKLFGSKCVYDLYKSAITILIQAQIRKHAANGLDKDGIEKMLESFKPFRVRRA